MLFLLCFAPLGTEPFVFGIPWQTRLFPNRTIARSIFVSWPIHISSFCLCSVHKFPIKCFQSWSNSNPPFHLFPSPRAPLLDTLPLPTAGLQSLLTIFRRHNYQHSIATPNHARPSWSCDHGNRLIHSRAAVQRSGSVADGWGSAVCAQYGSVSRWV